MVVCIRFFFGEGYVTSIMGQQKVLRHHLQLAWLTEQVIIARKRSANKTYPASSLVPFLDPDAASDRPIAGRQ